MERHLLVRQHLYAIEQVLRDNQLWQGISPQPAAFDSTQPFFMDTLEPHEWLQWVLIPRMHALLDSGQPLPEAFAIAPYYEMALDNTFQWREPLLKTLMAMDALFSGDND